MKILGSPFISAIMVLVSFFFIIRYWIFLSQKPWRYRYFLFSLRTFSLLFSLFLLINPWFKWTKEEQKNQYIPIICDLSESMFNHFENYPLQYDEVLTTIIEWGEKNNVDLNFFQLGRKITKLENMEFNELTTDYRNIPDFTSFEQPQQIILLTDGKATSGKNINEIDYSLHHPIHTVGIGPIETYQDVEIKDVIIPTLLALGDTVNIKIRIQARIHHSIYSDLHIINELDNEIYRERLHFEEGNHLRNLIINIPTDVLNGISLVRIDPVQGEKQIQNNEFSFKGDLQDSSDDILLITGALSANSRIIEKLLHNFEKVNIHHFFRMHQTRWNKEPLQTQYMNLKMIILDDFPIDDRDSLLFQKIVELTRNRQIPIMYIEGPWGNLTAGEMIHSAYPYFIPKVEEKAVPIDISPQSSWLQNSNIDIDQLPPQNRIIKWLAKENVWLEYIDKSVLIGNRNRFYLFSFPTLAKNYFKNNLHSHSVIAQLLQKILSHAFHINTGLLRLEVDKHNLNKGEIVKITLDSIQDIDMNAIVIYAVNGADTLELECSVKEHPGCSTTLLKSGEYVFYAQELLSNGEQIYSNTQDVIVQDVRVEMMDLIQERQALMEISHKTGGIYTPIDSLDTMLAHIDITPIKRVKYHQISGLSSQNFWWILILSLSIEWYFRKKLGLL